MLLEPFLDNLYQNNRCYRNNGSKQTNAPENNVNFPLAPAAHLKVVVDRAHLKDTLPGELEGGHLEHYTGRFTNVDDPDDQQLPLMVQEEGNGRQRGPDC